MCMRVGGCERVNVRLINIVELNEIRGISIYDKFKNIYIYKRRRFCSLFQKLRAIPRYFYFL